MFAVTLQQLIANVMKKALFSFLLLFFAATMMAQTDSTTFKGYLYNDEYKVYLKIDLYKQNITVPGQEVYGELPGYFGARRDTRLWLITDAKVDKKGKRATVSIINDFGSEDLTAALYPNPDGTFTLEQLKGSKLKIVVNRKWLKIPAKLILKKDPKRV